MSEGLPLPPKTPGPSVLPVAPRVPKPPPPPIPSLKKETMRLVAPPKLTVPAIPNIARPSVPGGAAPGVPDSTKAPPDLRKETMRISLPPRPAVGSGTKPPGVPPPSPKAPSNVASGLKPGVAAGIGAKNNLPTSPQPTPISSGGVRTVVDTDSAGTSLAIAALLAALISFGIVLKSFLEK